MTVRPRAASVTAEAGSLTAELLPVPSVRMRTEAQISGRACVWCGASTAAQPLSVLGPRLCPGGNESGELWYPLGCASCVGREASRVASIHVTVCPRCSNRTPGGPCPTPSRLRRLENGRPQS
jgi:hypothetical protein